MLGVSVSSDQTNAGLIASPCMGETSKAPTAVFSFECISPDGAVKWIENVHNTVFTVGKVNILDVFFGAVAKPAAWYLVLKGTGTEVAADTLASHASWTEQTSVYTSTNRPAVTFNAAAASGANGQIISTTTAVAITAGGTVAGCGLCQTQAKATNTGVLYNAGDFSSERTVASGDTLNCTVTLTQT